MKSNRRQFFGHVAAGSGALCCSLPAKSMPAVEEFKGWPDRFGMLTDLSLCIGCRKCEEACKEANQLPPLEVPVDDKSVFNHQRRTDAENFTVVNRFPNARPDQSPVFVKKQCMHCDEPACASACLVGALAKSPEGPVVYNKDICLGCRYCMVACPFYVPAYEYFNPTSPKVRKCTLCYERITKNEIPACAKVCPQEAITFGKRGELIKLAREKIRNHSGKYQDHIYGLNEAGGTSWLYISEAPFGDLGFPTDLGTKPFLKVTIGATIFGVILSTLHQSALGAMFLLAPNKLHPLWYSPYLPLFFFVSSIYGGLSMVIVESTLIRRFLPRRMAPKNRESLDDLTIGLGKGAALTLVTYFGLKMIGLAHSHGWDLLYSNYGVWFIIEAVVFVLLPSFLFLVGVRTVNAKLVRFTAFLTVLGVIANRFTVSMFAFNWQLPHREFFAWREFLTIAGIFAVEILLYRWIVNRMPVHQDHPEYPAHV